MSPGIVRAGAMGLVGEQPGGGKEEQAREMHVLTQLYLELNSIIFFKIPSRSNKMIDDVTYSKFSA